MLKICFVGRKLRVSIYLYRHLDDTTRTIRTMEYQRDNLIRTFKNNNEQYTLFENVFFFNSNTQQQLPPFIVSKYDIIFA